MDFACDSMLSGRRFRTLVIVDDYFREYPTLEVDSSILGVPVADVLDRMAEMSQSWKEFSAS
jgi:putative transposase